MNAIGSYLRDSFNSLSTHYNKNKDSYHRGAAVVVIVVGITAAVFYISSTVQRDFTQAMSVLRADVARRNDVREKIFNDYQEKLRKEICELISNVKAQQQSRLDYEDLLFHGMGLPRSKTIF